MLLNFTELASTKMDVFMSKSKQGLSTHIMFTE